jgi:formate hydrogenlyase subunit 3/multisubunit Na+/H+ antiporter MnhD subunit
LWHGYIYYSIFNLVLIISVFFLLRIYLLNFLITWAALLISSRVFVSLILFFFFTAFTTLNYLLDYYSELLFITSYNPTTNLADISIVGFYSTEKLYTLNALTLNLLQVYTYPFIYVFLLITILSIVFCLSYNTDELISFMFYCQLILLAGYALFYTDSIILFFFSYEILLVPSFFILYKFAKTRRCVEAAYLMFF